jgi:hypothetical protein
MTDCGMMTVNIHIRVVKQSHCTVALRHNSITMVLMIVGTTHHSCETTSVHVALWHSSVSMVLMTVGTTHHSCETTSVHVALWLGY